MNYYKPALKILWTDDDFKAISAITPNPLLISVQIDSGFFLSREKI